MNKGLVIGNSHAAMLIQSWRQDASRFAHMDLNFFTQPGTGPQGIEFDGTVMRAVDPELQEFLVKSYCRLEHDLNEYDFLVIIGCGPNINFVARSLLEHQVWNWPSNTNKTETANNPFERDQLISAECLHATLLDRYNKTLAVKLAKRLRKRSEKPIYIITQPLPSVRLAEQKYAGSGIRKLESLGNGPVAYQTFKSTLSKVLEPIKNLAIIFQPEETITRHIYTDLNFTVDAVKLFNLDKKQPKDDIAHANQHYGNLILNQLDVLCAQ